VVSVRSRATVAVLLSMLLSSPAALHDQSDLFRHDVAFCLGQRQDPSAVETLKQLVADDAEHPMCARATTTPLPSLKCTHSVLRNTEQHTVQHIFLCCHHRCSQLGCLHPYRSATSNTMSYTSQDDMLVYTITMASQTHQTG